MKKSIKIIVLLILALGVVIFLPYFFQNYSFRKSFEKNYQKEKISNTQSFIRCNQDFFSPEFAFLFDLGEGEEKHIAFHKTKKLFSQTEEGWDSSYTGGTTIKNTTFDELVKMVKEDCSQFQQAKGDWRDETINWSYSPYTPPEEPEGEPEPQPKRTEEEIERIRELVLQQNQ